MKSLLVILMISIIVSVLGFRFYISSVLAYLSVRLQRREKDLTALSSLRETLVHERKKKMAGLEMILSSWEKGEEIQARRGYFEELLGQLKNLVREERRDLMAVTKDIFLWGRLWSALRRVERISRQKREELDFPKARKNLARIQSLIDGVLEEATEKFSFTLNQVVEESVKIVRIEKSQVKDIEIKQQLDEAGDSIRFSYHKFKEWQRLLTNLIRNAVEAVEAKQSNAAGAAVPPLAGRGAKDAWVGISTTQSGPSSVTVAIEDSGIGMDEATRSSFFKKGYTSGKEHGLGLGVTEESLQFVEQYGNWQIGSRKGAGTRISIGIDQEKARKGELILPEEKPFYRTRLAFGLYFLALGLIGLALLFTFDKYSRFWVDWNPNSAQVQDQKLLIAYNAEGDELWRRGFDREIQVGKEYDREKRMEIPTQWVHIDDVNSDGKNEILVGFLESESEAGFLMCLDYKGIELWSFLVGTTEVYERGGQIYAPSREVFVVDIDQDGDKEIVLSSNCKTWFPCQLLVLSKEGGKEGEYWHSGHLVIQFIKDVDEDEQLEIVCGGINNHLGFSPVVFILDGKNVRGQSPPYRGRLFAKAKEEVYVKMPRLWDISTKVGPYPVGGIYYSGTGKGYEEYVLTVDDYERMRREYVVDQDLEPQRGVTFSYAFFDEWARLKQAGLIDFDVTPEVTEKWMKLERWEKGEKVR